MNRDSSFRMRAWICWGAILGSLAAYTASTHVPLARLQRLLERAFAKRGGIPSLPPAPKPPEALVAISCAAAALFLAVSLTRRGRAWMRMRPRLSQPSACGDTYLEAFTIGIVIGAVGVATFTFVGLKWEPLLYLGMVGSLVAIAYAFARSRSIRVTLAEWGWRRGRVAWREVAIGAFAGLVLALLGFLPRTALETDSTGPATSTTTLVLLRTLIWAPVVEETVFRGMLYRSLRDRWRWPTAVLVSAAVFAAVHQPVSRWPFVFVGGVLYALLREWRVSLLAPIAAHTSLNLVSVLVRDGVLGSALAE